ncbi:hypothetical protein [Mycoplasma leachii]|uniref:hypothetical protein n=1 Tax=Mycoplasma leachii TaxID=2105 RepID=UPI003DA26FE2
MFNSNVSHCDFNIESDWSFLLSLEISVWICFSKFVFWISKFAFSFFNSSKVSLVFLNSNFDISLSFINSSFLDLLSKISFSTWCVFSFNSLTCNSKLLISLIFMFFWVVASDKFCLTSLICLVNKLIFSWSFLEIWSIELICEFKFSICLFIVFFLLVNKFNSSILLVSCSFKLLISFCILLISSSNCCFSNSVLLICSLYLLTFVSKLEISFCSCSNLDSCLVDSDFFYYKQLKL